MIIKEGTITIFEGPQRCGKTLAMSLFARLGSLKGRPIFTNLAYTFDYTPLKFFELDLKNTEMVESIKGGLITIDEMNFWFDSRASMSGINRQFASLLLQTKKLGVDLYGTTHHLSYLDKRFRENYDYKVSTSVHPIKRLPGEPPKILRMIIENGPNQKTMKKTININFTKNPGLLGLYDTTNVFDPFEQMGKQEQTKKSGFVI